MCVYIYIYIYILAKTRQYPLTVLEEGSERKGNRSGKIVQEIRTRNSIKNFDPCAWHLRNACPSVRLKAKLVSKIDTKIDPKSVPGAAPGPLKSTQNQSQDPLGTPSGAQGRPGLVSERLGSVPWEPRELQESPQWRPGTPKEAPRNAPERAEATKIDAESRPQAKKSSFFRSARSRSVVGPIFRRFSSVFGFSAKSANPLKYCAC